MGPNYANIFVRYAKHQFFNQYIGPKTELYGRYIDDCIGAFSSSREELDQISTAVNSFHLALKYTWKISETPLAFLESKVSISGNGLCTSVHYKPTDSHSYMLYLSSPPSHASRTPFLILNFLDFYVYVVMTPTFPANQKRYASFFWKNVAVLSLWSKQAIIVPQKFDRQSALLNTRKISGPKRSVKITDRVTCTSANVIYCIICTLNCDLLKSCIEANTLKDMCETLNLTQLVTTPTRVTPQSSSLIDVILATNTSVVKETIVVENHISDHYLSYIVLNLKIPKPPPTHIITGRFRKYDASKFLQDLERLPWIENSLIGDVSERVDHFNQNFLCLLNKHAPVKKVKIKNRQCRRLKNLLLSSSFSVE